MIVFPIHSENLVRITCQNLIQGCKAEFQHNLNQLEKVVSCEMISLFFLSNGFLKFPPSFFFLPQDYPMVRVFS